MTIEHNRRHIIATVIRERLETSFGLYVAGWSAVDITATEQLRVDASEAPLSDR